MTEPAPYNPDPYPNKGYLFDEFGYHDGGTWLKDRDELYAWLNCYVPFAIYSGQELMVTDNLDACCFHVKNGKILWPNDNLIPPEGDE